MADYVDYGNPAPESLHARRAALLSPMIQLAEMLASLPKEGEPQAVYEASMRHRIETALGELSALANYLA